jgi:glycosyltransferase involved in cell wall biosynthesis
MARIAYVCADAGVPVFGTKGASVHVQEIVRAFGRMGHDITLFAARRGGEPADDLREVPVHSIPAPPKGDPAMRERAALADNRSLRRALARHGSFDVVYERYSLWSHAGMEFARREGLPGLLEVNAPLVLEQARHRTLVHRAAAERVAQRVFAAATALIAVSPGVTTYLRNACPAAVDRIHTIPNGVDPARFPAERFERRPGADSNGPFTIGFLGTLKPWHGLDVLMDAFVRLHAETPDIRLLVVGDGPQRESIESAAIRHGLTSAVHLTGAVAPSQVPDWLYRMDVAVAPYPGLADFYFSPLKIHEYMAAALPVVTSRVGDLDRVVEHGVTGLLYNPDDPFALAAALRQLQHDPRLRQRLGAAGRRNVLRHHGWDAVAAGILRLTNQEPQRNSEACTA